MYLEAATKLKLTLPSCNQEIRLYEKITNIVNFKQLKKELKARDTIDSSRNSIK
jgi:cytidylate kinase